MIAAQLAGVVKWQTRTLEVRMLKRLAGSTPVLGIKSSQSVN